MPVSSAPLLACLRQPGRSQVASRKFPPGQKGRPGGSRWGFLPVDCASNTSITRVVAPPGYHSLLMSGKAREAAWRRARSRKLPDRRASCIAQKNSPSPGGQIATVVVERATVVAQRGRLFNQPGDDAGDRVDHAPDIVGVRGSRLSSGMITSSSLSMRWAARSVSCMSPPGKICSNGQSCQVEPGFSQCACVRRNYRKAVEWPKRDRQLS
jgi:hypothetical protein